MKPVIFGIEGQSLTAEERDIFRAVRPAGYILFAHNIADCSDSRDKLRALTSSLRDLDGRDALPILIDQEGGRVARMKPPTWPTFPAGGAFDALYAKAPITALQAMRINAMALGRMLADVGITVNAAPVLDLRQANTHTAIGDRAYGGDPMQVAALGREMLNGLAAAGVAGIVKHMPGQGRATLDTHHDLAHVTASADELDADIRAFSILSDTPIAMTGHVCFDAWDAHRPATLSPVIIQSIIRERIGFDGLLLTDDLHMDALSGGIASRAAAAIAAGCDIALACWARGNDARSICDALPDMSGKTQARLDHAMAHVGISDDTGGPPDLLAMLAERDALLVAA